MNRPILLSSIRRRAVRSIVRRLILGAFALVAMLCGFVALDILAQFICMMLDK